MIETVDSCPSPEEVAAFAEGRLAGAEGERLIAHLAGCADCRELLAGTIETLADLDDRGGATAAEERGGAPRVARFPRRRWAPLVALAAALLVVSVIVVQRVGGPAQPPSREAWLASLPPAPSLVPNLWGGVVMRGDGEERPASATAAELGALWFDVEVAAKAADAARAGELLRRMAVITEQAGLLEGETATLRALAAAPPAELATRFGRELPAVETSVRERFPTFYLDLGAFVEAARVGGLAGDRGALDERAGQRYVEWLLEQKKVPLAPEVRRELEGLARPALSTGEQAEAAASALRALTR